MRSGQQSGYILLAVIVVITLVAAIALMMNTESAIETSTTGSEFDAQQARYVTEAGLNHALWQTAQQGCGAYSDLSNVSFGNDQYSSSLITDLGATTSYSVSVDRDTWIKSDSPTNNNAGDTVLHISNQSGIFERPMYRFDLTPVPANAAILSATAWFYVVKEHPEGFVDIHLITADWTETDATWGSMGANMDSTRLASIPTQVSAGVWVSVNLSAQVQAWVNGQPNYGITMNTSSEGVQGEYASRESANSPYLEVVVGVPPSSPANLKAVGTLQNGVSRSITRNDLNLYQQSSYHRLQLGIDPGEDTILDSFYDARNYGGANYLQVHDNESDWQQYPLIRFELSGLPAYASVHSARLELRMQSLNAPGSASVHQVTRGWVEGTKSGTGQPDGATWWTYDGANAWTSAGGDYNASAVAETAINGGETWVSWEIAPLVERWLAGEPNYGLLIKPDSALDQANFASREEADPTLHPKLSITYACACGEVCMGPQGSGEILMVVVNPTVLVASDAYKKQLFESWGYTVSVISESDNQATYDSAIAASDVVFISETVNSVQVGNKLAAANIGVVSQDGDYNADLGLAAGSAWTVASAINITDTSHYITAPFTTGLLDIYTGGMEQLSVSGSEAAGLQTLADTAGAGSLVVMDAGAALEGGGSAAGRRVMLPIGRDSSIDWSKLNSNGRLIVQRALQWGVSAGGIDPLILSTASDAVLGGLSFSASDLAEYDRQNDTASLYLDAVVVGMTSRIDALHVLENGHILLSTRDDTSFAGLSFNKEDLIEYDPVADTASMYLDADLHFQNKQDVISVHLLNNGNIVLSTDADATLGGLDFSEFDLVEYNRSIGNASIYFDGDATTLDNRISALHIQDNGHIVLAADGDTTLGGLSFRVDQLIDYDPVADTATMLFDGEALFSSTSEEIRSAYIGTGSGSFDDMIPIAHWKLDDAAGPTAIDSIGGHDGSLMNGPAWTTGQIDGALDFDGVDDYVDAGTFDVSGTGLTMMGWFNAETIPTSDGRIVSKADGTNDFNTWWQLGTTDSGSNRYLRMRIKAGGTTTTFADSSVNLSTGQWYFAVATYDNITGAMKLYLDGTEIASGSHAVGGALDSDASIPVAIGANGTAERFFDGVLDDVRVYNYALSDSEILDLYDAGIVIINYTEMAQTWSAGTSDSWETVDLGAFGVPNNAVVEVAITSLKTDRERWGGVRQSGSALDRRFLLHEAENGGVDAVTMHVQVDASGQIEHYADHTDEVKFTLLGYWTDVTYVEAFDSFKAGASNSWQGHNLGAYGVGANQVAEVVMAHTDANAEHLAGLRSPGSTIERRFDLHEAESGGIDAVTLMVETGASSDAQVFAETDASIDFYLVGYWTTPPGTYTETGGVSGQVSVASTWEQADLSGFGVPPGSIAQFVITNDSDTSENYMGLRQTGSSLVNRMLDLQEAESGGTDTASMQVNVDGSSQVEWYSQSGAFERFFFPVGWWVLAP